MADQIDFFLSSFVSENINRCLTYYVTPWIYNNNFDPLIEN